MQFKTVLAAEKEGRIVFSRREKERELEGEKHQHPRSVLVNAKTK
jgi:hypothetical protein